MLLSAYSQLAHTRLSRALGNDRGHELFRSTASTLGLTELHTPNDLLRFAQQLMTHGGLIESVGRSLKITAILHGANEAKL